MGKVINYIRVSAIDQNPERQIQGLPEADKVFIEKASGATTKRPELQAMFGYIRPGEGDKINVLSIDRLARNIEDLNKLVKQVINLGATIQFHKENITFGNGENSSADDLLFNILGSFAQFERSMIKERQAEGIAAAKAKGKHMGRPGKLTSIQKLEIKKKNKAGATPTDLSKEYAVTRGTIYNVIR
jgi:DNA invertase Pin-like site-specific DNA recombinase